MKRIAPIILNIAWTQAVRLAFVGAPAAAITAVMVVPILDPIRIASAPFSPMIFDSNNVAKYQ